MQGHGPGFVIIVVVAAALRRSRREVRPAPALGGRRRRGPRPRRRRGDLFGVTQSALVRVGLASFQSLLALDPGLGLAPGHLRLPFQTLGRVRGRRRVARGLVPELLGLLAPGVGVAARVALLLLEEGDLPPQRFGEAALGF